MGFLSAQTIAAVFSHLLPALIGAGGGYLFHRAIGCKTGACPITSNPWLSTLYGAVLGALMGPL